MSEVLSNTGVKLWAESDYSELWLTVFDQLTGQGGKSNIRLIDEAIGKINGTLDGYKFEFSSDEGRLYISKGDSKLPVSLIDSKGHVASKVDGTTITIDENGIVKGIPVDDTLSEESTNPLQNKVISGELKSIKSKMETDESAIKQNTSNITNNTKRIEANETAISTLNGTGDGSVKKAVSDGIAKVVAGAPEDLDTLKEMSDWISGHENDASAMNSAIKDNKSAITTLQTDKADKTEIPTVPTNVSEFTNDAGYLTEHQDISNLVIKEEGKGLSSNDYTSEEKTKLGGVGTSQGRNLIPYPYYNGTSFESNGVTYTVNEVDGTITVNGTATKESDFRLVSPYDTSDRKTLELGQTYTLSDGVNQSNSIGYQAPIYFQFVRIDATKNDFNYGISTNYGNMTWTASDANLLQYGIRIVVRSGVTVDNVVLKPMLEIGAIAHSYEPTTISNTTLRKKVDSFKQYTPDGTTITADEDGTLHGADTIQVDGITITRDDATKVIALAKTLQDKIALVDNKIDKANVANNLTTTEADFVLDARQGKALQDQLTTLNGSLNHINRITTTFKLFVNIPLLSGIHVFCVNDESNPITDSPYPNNAGWWNVICFGVGSGAQCMVQITSQVYRREFGFEGKNELWIRSLHDSAWSEWTNLLDLNNFRDISSNDDLNDIKFFNIGKYRCGLNIIAETVLNSPFTTAFTMEVFYSAGTPNYIAQKAIEFASGHCKWRMRDSGSGTIVQDWIQLY